MQEYLRAFDIEFLLKTRHMPNTHQIIDIYKNNVEGNLENKYIC